MGLTIGAHGSLDVLGRPDVHEIGEMQRVGALARVRSRDVEDSSVAVQLLGNSVLDHALRRVWHLEDLGVTDEVGSAAERGEGEGGGDVRSFEELGVVADLSELHDEVHETLDAVVVVEGRGAGDEVGDGDVLAEGAVHALLTGSEVAVDVDLDLGDAHARQLWHRGWGEEDGDSPCHRARSGRSS
jgi:hypothetical protein